MRHAGEDPGADISESEYRRATPRLYLFHVVMLPLGTSESTAKPDQIETFPVYTTDQLEVASHPDVAERRARGLVIAEIVGPGGASAVIPGIYRRAREAEDRAEAEAMGFRTAPPRMW
jgi:hypothetical protein